MCAKNFLKDMNYRRISEEHKLIIEKFNGNDFITISYLIKSTNINIKEIYDIIYELLDLQFLEVKDFSRCPHCLNDNIQKDDACTCKCTRCKKIYESQYIIEKFRILGENIE